MLVLGDLLQARDVSRPAQRPASQGGQGRRLWALTVVFGVSVACSGPLLPQMPRHPVAGAETTRTQARPLHAQGSEQAGENGWDRLWVVFDAELDPSTVHASRFAVIFADGARAMPRSAHFGPADEYGELRSLVLEGHFTDASGAWFVEHLQVLGPLFAADGAALEGQDLDVRAPGPPALVAAAWVDNALDDVSEPAPAATSSGGTGGVEAAIDECSTAWVLRTWWSGEVALPEGADAGLTWTPGGGGPSVTPPVGDVEWPRPDNVVDLCLARAEAGRIAVSESGLRGLGGGAALASSLRVDAPPSPGGTP